MASPAANANGHQRSLIRKRVLAEETLCWICNGPVDKALTYEWGRHGPRCKGDGCPGCVPHPMRAEVDEVIPRSKGGDPLDRDNCRLSHREHNRARGNSTTPKAPPTADPFPILSSWPGWAPPAAPPLGSHPLA